MEKREYIAVGTINITSDEVYAYIAHINKTTASELKETYELSEQDWKDCLYEYVYNGCTDIHDFIRKKG